MIYPFARLFRHLRLPRKLTLQQQRNSGHNAMEIVPSDYITRQLKDDMYFFSLLVGGPLLIFHAIVRTRENPELHDIPEGYEPRYWEYEPMLVTRFLCKYFFGPPEKDHEMRLSALDMESEAALIGKLRSHAKKSMSFYNDYRGPANFEPFFAEYFRKGREESVLAKGEIFDDSSRTYQHADLALPTKGYTEPNQD